MEGVEVDLSGDEKDDGMIGDDGGLVLPES